MARTTVGDVVLNAKVVLRTAGIVARGEDDSACINMSKHEHGRSIGIHVPKAWRLRMMAETAGVDKMPFCPTRTYLLFQPFVRISCEYFRYAVTGAHLDYNLDGLRVPIATITAKHECAPLRAKIRARPFIQTHVTLVNMHT